MSASACKTFGGRAAGVTRSFGFEKSPLLSRAASAGRQIHANFFLGASRNIKDLQDLNPKKNVLYASWLLGDAVADRVRSLADPPGECEAFVRSVQLVVDAVVDRVQRASALFLIACNGREEARSTTAPINPFDHSTNSPFQKEIVARPPPPYRSLGGRLANQAAPRDAVQVSTVDLSPHFEMHVFARSRQRFVDIIGWDDDRAARATRRACDDRA